MYLLQVIKYYNHELPSGESWNKHRRMAEAANNDVFASVQRMMEEPEHIQQQIDFSFAMAGVNIRIARETTSMALFVHEKIEPYSVDTLLNFYSQVSLVFDWIIDSTEQINYSKKLPSFKIAKDLLNTHEFTLDDNSYFIKVELEKIIFELETICLLIKEQKYRHKN